MSRSDPLSQLVAEATFARKVVELAREFNLVGRRKRKRAANGGARRAEPEPRRRLLETRDQD